MILGIVLTQMLSALSILCDNGRDDYRATNVVVSVADAVVQRKPDAVQTMQTCPQLHLDLENVLVSLVSLDPYLRYPHLC